MPVDHFPSTHATWIDAQLTIAEDGDRAAARGDDAGRGRATNARDAIRRGDVPGPRLYVAGNIVGWGGPFSFSFRTSSRVGM